jgi:hypothetical protein
MLLFQEHFYYINHGCLHFEPVPPLNLLRLSKTILL